MSPVGEASTPRNPKARSSRQFPRLLVLFAAGCLTTMTGGVVSPVLPEIVQQLQLDPRWAGTLVSMHAIMIAVFTPLLGILADRIGKLRVLLPALILYAVFGSAGAFMHSFLPLLATRALLGIASGGIAAATIGLLGTMYEGEARSRILGYATSAMTSASVMVPLIGGWAGQNHWQYAFFLYALALPLAMMAVFILPEKKEQRLSSSTGIGNTKDLIRILRRPETLRLLLTLMLAASIVYAVVIYTPLYLKAAIGADPTLNGFVLAVRAIGAAVMSAVGASRLAKWLGVNRAIALGFTLMALTLATIPFLEELYLILPTAIVFGMGFGLTVPNVYDGLANQAPPELRSSVLAIGTGGNSLGQFISPLFLGPIWHGFGLPAVFYVAAGVALSVAVWSLFRSRETAR
jgi:MFS transporter, ACDE family, multidrug resistance protein